MEKGITESTSLLNQKILEKTINKGKLKISDIEMFNPLALAYVGDAVYEAFVRTLLVSNGSMQVAKLHKKSIAFVKAKSQAEILMQINDMLTEEEHTIVKRGRNTKSATIPKNAEISDYRYATGFETLVGYLYLTGKTDRLGEIFDKIIEIKKDKI